MISLHPQQVYNWRAHRHKLSERAPHDEMLDVIAKLGGLQAQVMSAAELQAWARVDGITGQDIRDALWNRHSLVKTWAWRGTLHLLASHEFPVYVGALSTRARHLSKAWQNYFGISEQEMTAIMDAVRDALDGNNLTREQLANEVAKRTGMPMLRESLSSGWGSLLKPSAFRGDLCFGPSQGQSVTFVRPNQWIRPFDPQDSHEALKEMARRYMTTYGPASREDFARWIGITPPEGGRIIQAIVDEVEPVTVEEWKGWKGWALKRDVNELQSLHPTSSVRLLPSFDPYVVARSHASVHAVPDYKVNRERIYRVAAWVTPVVIVDGRIEGIWEYERRRNTIAVKLEMFGALSARVKRSIEEEVDRLGVFLGAKAELELAKLDK
jgi:uncharacterized protein YcaQ